MTRLLSCKRALIAPFNSWERLNKYVSLSLHQHVTHLLLQNQGLAEDTVNAQIDTLILDSRKKLNAIIGMYIASVM